MPSMRMEIQLLQVPQSVLQHRAAVIIDLPSTWLRCPLEKCVPRAQIVAVYLQLEALLQLHRLQLLRPLD